MLDLTTVGYHSISNALNLNSGNSGFRVPISVINIKYLHNFITYEILL